ncbi:unnamed protein product [Gordionus sp. m RMFG-2023]
MIGIINKTIAGNMTEIQSIILKEISTKELQENLLKTICVILAFGIPGNILMIFLVIASKHRCHVKQRSDFYFISLALANTLIFMIKIPWVVYNIRNFENHYSLNISLWFGKFEWFLEDSLICFVNYLLALMSMDRMVAIKYPFMYSNLFKFKNIKKYVYTIMVVSLIIASPFLNYFHVKRIHPFRSTNNIMYNMTIHDMTGDATSATHELSDRLKYLANIDPIYTYVFNEKMRKFSSIFDEVEAVFMNLIPCIIILTSNVITATLFYKRSRSNMKRLNLPAFSVSQPIDHMVSNNPFFAKKFHSETLPKFEEQITNAPQNFIDKDIPSIHSARNLEKFESSSQIIPKGNQISPRITMARSVSLSEKMNIIKARNRDFTILMGFLSLASLIFSLPWLIFVFQKGPAWEDDYFLVSNPKLHFFVNVMMYLQYFTYPYLIILTSPLYRKYLLKCILCRSYSYKP